MLILRVLLLRFKLVVLDAKSNTVVQSLSLQRNEQEVDVYDLKPGNSYLACLQLHVSTKCVYVAKSSLLSKLPSRNCFH